MNLFYEGFVRQTPEMAEPTAIFKFLIIQNAFKMQSELISQSNLELNKIIFLK